MTLDELWLRTLEEVVSRAAHDVKDALNGVAVNVEVLRSRAEQGRGGSDIAPFATAAADQLEIVTHRVEAVLYLARPPREPADVGACLKHLAALLVPAARADGRQLRVDGAQVGRTTSASAGATRLALAAGLLALSKEGGGCHMESGTPTVVRFSHESATTCNLDPAVAKAIAEHNIQAQRSGQDLLLSFPGNT